MDNVVAKFTCLEVSHRQSGATVTLEPVRGNSPENQRFYNYTPTGSIVLGVINGTTADQFTPGEEYFVRFSGTNADGSEAGLAERPNVTNKELADGLETALVSFGNYLLNRYGVQVHSTDGLNTPLYPRRVTDADLRNWESRQQEAVVDCIPVVADGTSTLEPTAPAGVAPSQGSGELTGTQAVSGDVAFRRHNAAPDGDTGREL